MKGTLAHCFDEWQLPGCGGEPGVELFLDWRLGRAFVAGVAVVGGHVGADSGDVVEQCENCVELFGVAEVEGLQLATYEVEGA